MMNVAEQRAFNGLPSSNNLITVLDENVRKNAEAGVDGYEMVFEVLSVGGDCDLMMNEVGGVTKVTPLLNVGDIVLAKGNVFKMHCEPVVYAATRENIVAILKRAEDRENYVATK
jgi:hypothetical protein